MGLRSYHVDPHRGLVLNGQPYPLHGVSRHQDRLDKGWADRPDERPTLANIIDLGCTAVRLAHYQQSPSFYDLCDAGGVVVWAEVPLVNRHDRLARVRRQRRRSSSASWSSRTYNHPAICFWGLSNELSGGITPAEADAAAPVGLQRLNGVAHRLDPTRPTTAASHPAGPTSSTASPT